MLQSGPHRGSAPARTGACLAWLLWLVLATPAFVARADNAPAWLPALLEQERITIVVTDSGLGGLSVVADAAEKFRRNPVFSEVELVFVNALFTNEGGYNSLRSRAEKLRVLDSALRSMHERFAPDLILVACNTLSVLVPDTPFARTAEVPVAGIVDDGVAQIAERLRGRPAARNIIMATQTTVDEGEHQRLLLDLGIGAGQIVPQACPQLTLHIEQGYDSEFTEMLIDAYVDEALSRMGEIDGPLYVSFNCTHFGYSLELWQRAFASRGVEVEMFLDPNTRMVDFLLPPALRQRHQQAEIRVRVVSMIDIPTDRLDSIGRWLHAVSPDTEAALRRFERHPDLFEWRAHLAGEAR
jgi:glutamate racemase